MIFALLVTSKAMVRLVGSYRRKYLRVNFEERFRRFYTKAQENLGTFRCTTTKCYVVGGEYSVIVLQMPHYDFSK